MSAVNPENFKRKPEDILQNIMALKTHKHKNFLEVLEGYASELSPNIPDESRRAVLKASYGDENIVAKIKLLKDVLSNLSDASINHDAVQNGLGALINIGLHAERQSQSFGNLAMEYSGLASRMNKNKELNKYDRGLLPLADLESVLRRIDYPEEEIIVPDVNQMVRESTRDSAQISQQTEQELALLKRATGLIIELCDSLNIPVKDAARSFASTTELGD